MVYDYGEIHSRVKDWGEEAVNQGWINQTMVDILLAEECHCAAELISSDNASRPLIVAFMGGTGVGKSSLLNRMAAQAIAKVGEERPTSHEVTLYYHQSISMPLLQEIFPVQQIKLSRHSGDANQHIIWLDMPDFDSTEQKNKDIVLQWLPFTDLLIYVVSPERYRDNKAWQLLLSRGANHAWVFVLNQWDRGVDAQYDDFKQQLSLAGFNDPLVFKTVCNGAMDDEFSQLQTTISKIATDKTIEQLKARGLQKRSESISHKLQDCLQTLGNQHVFAILADQQNSSWLQTRHILRQGFQWSVQDIAKQYAEQQQEISVAIWNDWAQSRFNDFLDDLIVAADQQGLPTTPIRMKLLDWRKKAGKIVHTQTELGCRQALINPGNALQRLLLKTANIAELTLPLLAMSIVAYQVFQGFYHSSVSKEAFLGVDFAVHSSLLIAISWLLPFFIGKKMQPSLEKTALKGLSNGLDKALVMLDIELKQTLNSFKNQHKIKVEELNQIIVSCNHNAETIKLNPSNKQLNRMLVG